MPTPGVAEVNIRVAVPNRPRVSAAWGGTAVGETESSGSVTCAFMALDEATRLVYRGTDSAALLGLLPELRRLVKAAQKERERVLVDQPDDDGRFAADLASYAATASEREAWIRTELKRRGLLPLWPGEENHVSRD